MFKPGSIVRVIQPCTKLTLGKTYTVLSPMEHYKVHGFMSTGCVCLWDDTHHINAWSVDRFELVASSIDYLAITRSVI